jgi:hypothetical protein
VLVRIFVRGTFCLLKISSFSKFVGEHLYIEEILFGVNMDF